MINIQRVILFTIFVTLTLVSLGGYVHNTQSSLACPDWPLCFGQVFPVMEGGVLIEHSHRLLGALVGFLTLITFIFSFKNRKKYPKFFKISSFSLLFVIIQGILGGITVIYKLPTIVSTTHLGLSMVYLMTMVLLYHEVSLINYPNKFQVNKDDKDVWQGKLKDYALISFGLVYTQMILGAFIRHSGVGASCGVGYANSLMCFETTTWLKSWWPSSAPSQVHMVHRFFAIVVFSYLTYSTFKLLKFFKSKPFSFLKLNRWVIAGFLLVIFQIKLGIMTVGSSFDPVITMLHLLVAALILLTYWKIYNVIKTIELNLFENKTLPTPFLDLIDLTKPKLSLLVMTTVFVGIVLAPTSMNFFKVILTLILIAFIVTGATTLNCLIEKDVDAKMERTKDRPLPAGRMSSKSAAVFGFLLLGLSIPLSFLLINWQTAVLGLISAVLYLTIYTPLKQKSTIALLVGAIPGALPPVMGWVSNTNSFDLMSLALFIILFVWQIPHFLAIAIYHSNDYKGADIIVTPNIVSPLKVKLMIFTLTIVLALTSLTPYWVGYSSLAYRNSAIFLGTIFVILSFFGLLISDEKKYLKWARQYFWGSIVYLPLLLGSMIFFQ